MKQIHCARGVALVMLLTTVSCAGASNKKSAVGPGDNGKESLELDTREDWIDPGDDETPAPGRWPGRSAVHNKHATRYVIKNATILTATGKRFDAGMITTSGGSIEYVGAARAIPSDATVIDAAGKFVTPGLIDTHSHIGVYAAPNVSAHSDGNEFTVPVTAEARAAYGYFPQDPAITRARAGGVTTAQILPGSANMIGGRGFIVVMRPGRTIDDVRFPQQKPTIKMACGENPKRSYGRKGGPYTRMGIYARFRAAFKKAAEYNAKLRQYNRALGVWRRKRARASELEAEAQKRGKDGYIKPEKAPEKPAHDAGLATLAAVLRGEVLVQIHCYRASEISEMVAIAKEFKFAIRSFHHALEAYKIRDLLAKNSIAISTWADWWGFKMEAFDGIPQNAALFTEAGGRAVIHSDSPIGIQRLNQEAAKAMYAGRRAGIKISENQALRWITANAAWVIGLHDVVGTLERGKRADVVVWNKHPFSVYAKPDLVFQAGELTYDRAKGMRPTDFELGNSASAVGGK